MWPSFALVALCLSSGVTANDAIHANPSSEAIGLTTGASDWLWAVFAIMLLSDLIFIFWHFRLLRGQRIFHQLPILILTTASIAYFSMASNLGHTGIPTEFRGSHRTRAIWYVRYIYWVIATPLLLLELLLGTGLPLSDIVTVIFMDIVMFVCWLIGALVASSYKWGYYTFGLFALFYLWSILLGPARKTALLLGPNHRSAFTRGAGYLCFVFMLYPICWGLAEGSNTISVTGEMIFYGIIDILAQPIFLFLHVGHLRRLQIPFDSYGFTNFHNGIGNSHDGAINGLGAHGEKRGLVGARDTDTTGTTGTNGAGVEKTTAARGGAGVSGAPINGTGATTGTGLKSGANPVGGEPLAGSAIRAPAAHSAV